MDFSSYNPDAPVQGARTSTVTGNRLTVDNGRRTSHSAGPIYKVKSSEIGNEDCELSPSSILESRRRPTFEGHGAPNHQLDFYRQQIAERYRQEEAAGQVHNEKITIMSERYIKKWAQYTLLMKLSVFLNGLTIFCFCAEVLQYNHPQQRLLLHGDAVRLPE